MSVLGILKDAVSGIVAPVGAIIDNLHTSEEEKLEAKLQLQAVAYQFQEKILASEAEIIQAQRDVVVAEAKGESWLQRSWRPMLMVLFGLIIANNYVIAPYVQAFGGNVPTLEIPTQLWALLTLGVGGYIGGRSAEKIVKTWKNGGTK